MENAVKNTDDTLNSIPKSFKDNPKSSVNFMTKEIFEEILPSYLPNKQDQLDVMDKWEKIHKSKMEINTVPMAIRAALGPKRGEKLKQEAIEFVKSENEKNAPDNKDTQTKSTTLHRADNRSPEQIKQTGGFHGWGGSISIEHAKKWAKNFEAKQQMDKNQFLQTWKAQTSSRNEEIPYVATGWEAQKAGEEYTIKVPFEIGNPNEPAVFYNSDSIESSTVFILAGRDEAVFLTGIPNKYINNQLEIDKEQEIGAPSVSTKQEKTSETAQKPTEVIGTSTHNEQKATEQKNVQAPTKHKRTHSKKMSDLLSRFDKPQNQFESSNQKEQQHPDINKKQNEKAKYVPKQ